VTLGFLHNAGLTRSSRATPNSGTSISLVRPSYSRRAGADLHRSARTPNGQTGDPHGFSRPGGVVSAIWSCGVAGLLDVKLSTVTT